MEVEEVSSSKFSRAVSWESDHCEGRVSPSALAFPEGAEKTH